MTYRETGDKIHINEKTNAEYDYKQIDESKEEYRLSKKSWERKECDGCKSYNPECRIGACSIYPHQKQKKVGVKEIEIHDTG